MALKILELLSAPPNVYFQQGFFVTLESHIEYLKQHPTTRVIQLDPLKVDAHQGDFYGMLSEVGVAPQYHWITLRINDMATPTEFDESKYTIYVPDTALLDRIRTSYNTIAGLNL